MISFYCLSEEIFDFAYSQLSESEKSEMYLLVNEAANIIKFASYTERLLFEDAMKKGFLSSKLKRIS